MLLHELIPTGELIDAIEKGYVRCQVHPSLPYRIYNYTEQAQHQRYWNAVTMNCRGLIVNFDTEEIIARPWEKFFNDQEHISAQLVRQFGPVEVTDKLDGSLGIMYPVGPGLAHSIATRGSFTSDQALHATQVYHRKYLGKFKVPKGWTMLFEIIYPENRIVVDYGDMDDLVLLGAVHIDSGATVGPDGVQGWPGPRAEVFPYRDYNEALRAPLRPGKEGLVLRWPETHFQVKLKQQDYVELHRIVTSLNERSIWQRLADGRDLYDGIPDELHAWVSSVADPLRLEFDQKKALVHVAFHAVGARRDPEHRGEFARAVSNYGPWVKTCMFLLLDGKSIDGFLWKQLRPVGPTKRARGGSEDVA